MHPYYENDYEYEYGINIAGQIYAVIPMILNNTSCFFVTCLTTISLPCSDFQDKVRHTHTIKMIVNMNTESI